MAEPETLAIGTLVRAKPPLRGYDDVVKRLVQMLDAWDIGGSGAAPVWRTLNCESVVSTFL